MSAQVSSTDLELPKFKHLLVAFGGLNGLEECIRHDRQRAQSLPTEVFNIYLNTCPNQGSRCARVVGTRITRFPHSGSRYGITGHWFLARPSIPE